MKQIRSILKDIMGLINIRTVAGALAVAALLTLLMVGALVMTRENQAAAQQSTAVIAVISAPTLTPSPSPTSPITPTPTLDVPPSPLPGTIGAGGYVQITGTGGDGLRLRTDAGLNAEIGFLGWEAEVFQVIDGPRDADGFTWWLLESLYDEGQKRRGWAVSNFLSVVQNP